MSSGELPFSEGDGLGHADGTVGASGGVGFDLQVRRLVPQAGWAWVCRWDGWRLKGGVGLGMLRAPLL